MKHKVLASFLAFGCLICVAVSAACSRSESSNQPARAVSPGQTGAQENEPITRAELPAASNPFAPDVAYIIVRDLNGFFDDCGCGGPIRGGVARMPSTAAGAKKVHYVFIGNTALPAPNSLTSAAADPNQLRKRIEFAVEVLSALPSATLLSGSEEWEFLTSKLAAAELEPLRKFLKDKLIIAGVDVRVTQDDLDLCGLIPLPQAGNRARDIVVVGLWRASRAGAPILDRSLGSLWRLANDHAEIRDRFDARLAKAAPVASYWHQYLSVEMPEDPNIREALDNAAILRFHDARSADISAKAETKPVERCEGCHSKAVVTWKTTRHSKAYGTLVQAKRSLDLRCLPCHVESYETKGQSLEVTPDKAAVTCMSCHEAKKVSENQCLKCHTLLTDPKAHFRSQVKTICSGSVDELSGDCRR